MKDFDIYLRKHLTECDIIINSIPYRDGLTVFHRMILESCLEDYLLQKFVAAQTGSELQAHIDKMIETVYERLNSGVRIGASVDFAACYTVPPIEMAVELQQEQVNLLASTFERATGEMQIAVAPLLALAGKSLGGGGSSITLTQTLCNMSKVVNAPQSDEKEAG